MSTSLIALNFTKTVFSDIEKVTRDVSRKKSSRLKIGSVLFVAALAATSISIVWLGAQPATENKTEEKTVYFVVVEDEARMLENLSGLEIESASIVVLSDGNLTHSPKGPAEWMKRRIEGSEGCKA